MDEANDSRYSIHPGDTKMYHNLHDIYWWNGMKKDVAKFVLRLPNYQQLKAKHQGPGGLTQYIDILTWKWEDVNMDFVVGFPRTRRKLTPFR